MELWFTDRTRLVLLLSACTLLASLEALVPLFKYRRGRLRRALPNLALAIGVLLINLALSSLTALLSAWARSKHIGLMSGIQTHPWVLTALGVAGLDLFAYLAHLLLHKIPLGWAFHRVHHSELEVDVTTAFRQHPGETLWRTAWLGLGIIIFGIPFWITGVYLSLSGLSALLEHANVRMREKLDEWLRVVIVTPNMHKTHHSRIVYETDSNYSNIFSVWDRIFGTYTAQVDCQQLRYGLEGFDGKQSQTLRGLLRRPFQSS
jgi:sterol desaturase/sphingolipid hydroxylase (fatty acid hydroxylase superfamily)